MIVIFIFLCVIIVSVVLAGGWLIMSVIRFIGTNSRPYFAGSGSQCCGNPGCRTINPIHAHYCRRCGSDLTNLAANANRAPQRPPRFNPNTGSGRQVANV